tara:strand:- start:5885 stop:6688 length:804 start_codon:yes stop_codon:yes gene_type:complete
MSIKSILQILILLLLISIVGAVYFEYFRVEKKIVEEINSNEESAARKIEDLENKITNLETKNKELNSLIVSSKIEQPDTKSQIIIKNKKDELESNKKNIVESKNTNKNQDGKVIKKDFTSKKEITNLVKDVEYLSVDQKGNKFILLANSGKSNINNNNVLDLDNVRGKIISDSRDTIYIVSDFGQYNSLNLNSRFYENVVINYQDKEITCENFDINMETNMAIAYSNVIITDPKSVMKAGIVEFDLKTKNININPETSSSEVEVISN